MSLMVRTEGMNFEFTKAATECHVLIVGDVLVAKEDHLPVE